MAVASIFEYIDYRKYLRDYLDTRKQENSAYSMRALASKIQCNPGFFNRILTGERNLMPAHVVELSNVMKLSKKELRYFELLVSFNHAKKQLERDHYFEQMQQFRKMHIKEVTVDQFAMYTHWYYLVLRELLSIYPDADLSEGCCRKIAREFQPPISPSQVREALLVLLALGVIRKNEQGILKPLDSFTASGSDVPQVIVNRFLLEFAGLASQAIDMIPRQERRFSTLTFTVSEKMFIKMSERIDEFRRELLCMVEQDDGDPERVYHMNFHLFPVTRNTGKKKP